MILGTIYKIVSNQTPKYYIGSTILSLNKRLAKHKWASKSRGCTSKLILQYDDAKIEKLYDIEVETIKELREIERNEVMANRDNLVNKFLTRTKQEQQKIQNKKRYQNHRDRIHAWNNTVVNCDHCDKTYTKANKSRHMKRYHLNIEI